MKKRLIILTLQNLAIAFGIILSLFLFGFGLLLLNNLFGTPLLSLILVGSCMLVFLISMCYKIAQERLETEEHRNRQVMNALKKDYR